MEFAVKSFGDALSDAAEKIAMAPKAGAACGTAGGQPALKTLAAAKTACLPTNALKKGGGETRDAPPSNVDDVEDKVIAYSDEPTALYSRVRDADWSGAIKAAKRNPIEASTWIVEKNTDGTTRWELLPLHLACERRPPIAVVEALLAAYGSATHKKDSGGDLPIHLACRERAAESVVLTLLLKDPDTAKVADDEGRLPIHLASRQSTSQEVVDRLLIAHHRASKTTDLYGLLPLHWACAQNASAAVVQSLLRANPYAVDHADKWGRTPLSLAQASTNAEREAVIVALNRDPAYWTASLTEEVKAMEKKLGNASAAERKARAKAQSLEARLVEVTDASKAATQSFRELKTELEEENTMLKTTVRDLDASNKNAEEQIGEMRKKNNAKMARNDDLAARLGKLMEVLSEMEEQRLAVLRITGDWEDSLQKASDLVHLDDKEKEEL